MTTKIKVTVETTINLGNYENIKLSYGIEDEPRGDEKAPDTFERVKNFIDAKIIENAAEVSSNWAKIKEMKDNAH